MKLRTRLPGIRFETTPPVPADVLPRMDVTAFVGFAASGPLHVPVAVEDPAAFAELFGADAPLAWDPARGEVQNAHLAPAVRAFFRNGGKRCWVIRVAGAATANVFPLPSLVAVAPDGSLHPAFARARSEGSWSDDVRVATALVSELLNVVEFDPAEPSVGLRARDRSERTADRTGRSPEQDARYTQRVGTSTDTHRAVTRSHWPGHLPRSRGHRRRCDGQRTGMHGRRIGSHAH